MSDIKGVFDHKLRLRQNLGSGQYGKADFDLSVNADAQCVFVEFDECPTVMFSTPDLVHEAYQMLEKEGYMKNGKRTDKQYKREDYKSKNKVGKGETE